ncbi:serine/threonine protein kinase [Roseiconus nitratireducens]|uniref:Serine/threonine protein kinase n=1 Tax=Roseiconus nitratireducens TaxID=2605748 RepID=A0A5M6D7N5_9BACT|nr:serine/threonine-protein kinase [Roseiconus nitratireducens]KAA5542666.1 serine/threonine protein kinase [Roseiconus nitratireducens]
MHNSSSQVESLFAAAAELSAESRKAFLDRECAGQEALRRQLDGLLRAHDRVDHPLDRPVAGHNELEATCLSDAQSVGTLIAGRYKLLEQIGDGGMGTVWMAEQKEPVRRLVAVKLIKAGMDSKAVLARFEAERQALALMDHPNIAKVHDAGTDDAGRPFFVMELVKGLPLTEYCDARKLFVNERLDLFVQICSAVQHAHQKAIIHRDLKPSNVLVTEHDGRPVPKVIDFGLAKAINSSQMLTDRTLHTAFGTVVGTPLYMAPEQVGINALDVDTRTDIYALGVILYELLTGTTPLEKARFKVAAWEEVKRLIREEDPPRPSTRLSSDKTLPSLAACRQVDASKLPSLVRGDLDWIVMKALDKDRSRRYETANGLAKDVQRYLKGDAVEACPPTLAYRLQKACRKHRVAILTIGAFAGVLLISTVLSLTFGIRAHHAEMKARQETEAASFLLDTFLGTNDEHEELTVGNVPFTTVVDRAVKQLDRDTERLPLTVARIRARIGRAYAILGKYPKARQQIQPALEVLMDELGPNNLETLNCQESLVWVRESWDEKTEAILLDVLERRRKVQGPDHPDTIRTLSAVAWMRFMNNDMVKADSLLRDALQLAVAGHGDDSVIAIRCKMRLAAFIARKGKHDECMRLAQEAMASGQKLPSDDPYRLFLKYGANKYAKPATGTSEDNRRVAEQDVALLPEFKDVFGEDDPRTLVLLDDITLHYAQGKWFDEAEPYSKTLLEKRTQLFERDDRGRLRALWLRGLTLLGLKKIAEAKELFNEAIPLARSKREHIILGTTLVGLGECLLLEENYAEAEPKLASGYEMIRSYFKNEGFSAHRLNHVREVLDDLVAVSEKLGKSEAAEHWRKEKERLEQF